MARVQREGGKAPSWNCRALLQKYSGENNRETEVEDGWWEVDINY